MPRSSFYTQRVYACSQTWRAQIGCGVVRCARALPVRDGASSAIVPSAATSMAQRSLPRSLLRAATFVRRNGISSSRTKRITNALHAPWSRLETGQPTYWRHVGESNTSECARLCDAGGHECTGFVHQRTGEWSCGVTYHNDCPGAGSGFNGGGLCYERNGGCAVPGTCYFFNNQTYSQHGTREVTPDESGALMRRAMSLGRASASFSGSPHLLDDATAGARCADDCFGFYRGDAKAQADTDRSAFTLDVLAANMSEFEWIARLEQSLETKLLSPCNAHPRMREILLDFLERWRGIGGSVFVAQPSLLPARPLRDRRQVMWPRGAHARTRRHELVQASGHRRLQSGAAQHVADHRRAGARDGYRDLSAGLRRRASGARACRARAVATSASRVRRAIASLAPDSPTHVPPGAPAPWG